MFTEDIVAGGGVSGYQLDRAGLNAVIKELSQQYRIFSPKRFELQGEFSDTDSIRYGEIKTIEEAELNEKSSQSFKEVLIPISETLFYFTEDKVTQAQGNPKKAIIFLRSCDLHAVKRLDDIYLNNGAPDFYYKRLRENVKFILIGCAATFENCFCVDMGSNISTDYDASLDEKSDGFYYMDSKFPDWDLVLEKNAVKMLDVTPEYVRENSIHVSIPDEMDSMKIAKSEIWDEYDARCIACGRCNFSCPSCTCFSAQDIFYTENGKTGERRRVWASCMVDGFSDVAGGGCYRKKHGERMRFKVLHKVLDHKKRFGNHMCVGCGRCDDVCPEYISFSNAINKLNQVEKEADL